MHRRHIQEVQHIRTGEDGFPRIDACFVKYGVLDSFKTRFASECFKRALEKRANEGNMPNVRWQHQVGEPIGSIESVEERADGLYGTFRLDADPAVPRAMQALFQLKSGTLKDVSVGFSGDYERGEDGVPEFRDVDLNELSIVSQGAVPGAKVLSMRSQGTVMSAEEAARILVGVEAGTMSLREALDAIESAAIEEPKVDPALPEVTEAPENPEPVEETEEVEPPTEEEVASEPELTDEDLSDEPIPEDERADAPSQGEVPGSNAAQLKKYWTKGPGLAKWRNSTKPWTTLYGLLKKYITDERKLKATVSRWFIEVFGETAAQHAAKAGRSAPEIDPFAGLDDLASRVRGR